MNEMLKCYAVYASDERGVECNEWKEVEVSYHQRSKMRGRVKLKQVLWLVPPSLPYLTTSTRTSNEFGAPARSDMKKTPTSRRVNLRSRLLQVLINN